ncbi:MAG: amino acid ABC transporter permease [Acidimicrobiaceae bacterium]|nr:amino acid ABC transporter permease [Acidimicrobiaceae bacterium]
MAMSTQEGGELEVVPVRHVGQWIGAFVVVVAIAMVVRTLFFSYIPTGLSTCVTTAGKQVCREQMKSRFPWQDVRDWFFSSEILHGVLLTLELTVIAMVIGIVLGVCVAIMRLSSNRLLSGPAWVYTWFFRGTPVYVQLFFWFNVGLLYPRFSLGLPFLPISFLSEPATIISGIYAAILGLGLNEAAYMAEIARAGIISVDEGQVEAATSLGMTKGQTLRLVVLPQAMRVIIPPTGNEVISMLKTTSLAASISVLELFGAAQNIYAGNYKIIGLIITASLWYLLMTTVLSIGQFYVERHFARGALRTQPKTPIQRLRQDFKTVRGYLGHAEVAS